MLYWLAIFCTLFYFTLDGIFNVVVDYYDYPTVTRKRYAEY